MAERTRNQIAADQMDLDIFRLMGRCTSLALESRLTASQWDAVSKELAAVRTSLWAMMHPDDVASKCY